MDAQIQERLAKQGAELLRLGDENKALRRRLRRQIPVGAGGEPLSPGEAAVGEEASVRVEVVSDAALDAAEGSSSKRDSQDPDVHMRHVIEDMDARCERLTAALKAEVEALKRRKDSPSAAAMAKMSDVVLALELERDDAVAALQAAKEAALKSTADTMDRLEESRDALLDELHAIREEFNAPEGEALLDWLQCGFEALRDDGPSQGWRRDLWRDVYVAVSGREVDPDSLLGPQHAADAALGWAEERFGTKPLDSTEDDSEG